MNFNEMTHGREREREEQRREKVRQTIVELANWMACSAHHILPNDIRPNPMHYNVGWHTASNLLRCRVCLRTSLRPLRLRVVLRQRIMRANAPREVVRERHYITSHCSPRELTVCLCHRECRAVGSAVRRLI